MRLAGPVLLALLAWLAHACLASDSRADGGELRWWKGNTHTHTLWSDGDGAPELVADWYREHGYHFLVLSDHNVLSQGETWFPVEDEGRLRLQRLEHLIERFGADRVELRSLEGRAEMRLATLSELRARFEVRGSFLFLQGEEITDAFEGLPVHVNGVNLAEVILPRGGTSLRDTLQNDLDAVAEQSRRLSRPMLAHVNHPNYGWALTWEDLAALERERFFEVYNGHPAVNNHGDAEHPGLEEMWDLALTRRLSELGLGLLFGVASDDAHNYHEQGAGLANAGRGWVRVRARELSPAAIVEAMRRGDFHASSGVEILDFASDGASYRVHVAMEPGVSYLTRFIGTRVSAGGEREIGAVLEETSSNPATYRFRGDELYVRAVVLSDRPHPNPYASSDLECAWLQPVLGPIARP